MTSKNLKNLINSIIQEYTGTGAMTSTGLTSDDGNNVTSQRSRFDTTEDEMNFYLNQNKGKGGDGGHYRREPAFHGRGDVNFNRTRLTPYLEELKGIIKKMLEEIDEQAYGSATITTQGSSRSGAIAPTNDGKYPYTKFPKRTASGYFEQKTKLQEQGSINPRIAAIDRELQNAQDKIADLNIEKQEISIDDQIANAGKQSAQATLPIAAAEKKIVDLNKKEKDFLRQKTELRNEFKELKEKEGMDLSPEEVSRLDILPSELEKINTQLFDIRKQKKEAIASKENLIKQKNQSASQSFSAISQAKAALLKQKTAMKKQKKTMQEDISSYKGMDMLKYYLYRTNNDNNKKVSTLIERMDSYKNEALQKVKAKKFKKTELLKEGAMKKFFKLFNKNKTNEEILRIYAENGIVVPESFISKARKQYENLQKQKLEIEFSEQEAKDFKKVPLIDEEETVENKELSTRLFKEQKTTKYAIPTEIENALVDTLKMDPLIRFVKNLKAVNSIPPSYRVFLLNNNFFDIYYENDGLMAKINKKEYYLDDKVGNRGINYAIKHINRLMVEPIISTGEDEEELEEPMGGSSPKKPTGRPPKATGSGPAPVPTPSPTPEPEDEE